MFKKGVCKVSYKKDRVSKNKNKVLKKIIKFQKRKQGFRKETKVSKKRVKFQKRK